MGEKGPKISREMIERMYELLYHLVYRRCEGNNRKVINHCSMNLPKKSKNNTHDRLKKGKKRQRKGQTTLLLLPCFCSPTGLHAETNDVTTSPGHEA